MPILIKGSGGAGGGEETIYLSADENADLWSFDLETKTLTVNIGTERAIKNFSASLVWTDSLKPSLHECTIYLVFLGFWKTSGKFRCGAISYDLAAEDETSTIIHTGVIDNSIPSSQLVFNLSSYFGATRPENDEVVFEMLITVSADG